MSAADWIAVVGIVISLATLLVSIILQLRMLNRQIRQANFSELTRRYHEIFLPIPVAFDVTAKLDEQSERDKLLQHLRAYFNLCSEQYRSASRRDCRCQGLKNMVVEFSTGFPEADHLRGLGGGPESIVLR